MPGMGAGGRRRELEMRAEAEKQSFQLIVGTLFFPVFNHN